MSLILNVEILGEFKKLTAATKGAGKDLNSLSGQAAKISKGMNRAFAAIGIGLSFRVLANEIQEATAAAIEDRKSQVLLANAMENTTGATADQIAAAEKAIGKLQLQAGVADDKLRPAYQKLFLATKDVTESNRLLALALDVSAGTGKDLDVVSQAMAKSLAGSDTALLKLIPSLKGSKTPMDDLAKAFGGAAEKAANVDPYQRMKIVFDELQEQIGMALLPSLEKFSAWVSSPEGQAKLQGFIDLVVGLAGKFEGLASFAIDNANAIITWSSAIAGAAIAIKGTSTAIGIYNGIAAIMAARNAAGALSNAALGTSATVATGQVAGLTTGLRALTVAQAAAGWVGVIGALAGVAMSGTGTPGDSANPSKTLSTPVTPLLSPGKVAGLTQPKATPTKAPVNVNVYTPKVTAQEITNLVNKAQKNGYTGMITIPRSR